MRYAIAVILAGVFQLDVAFAGGPFDGEWKGTGFIHDCKLSSPTDFTITVSDNKISGVASTIHGPNDISGTVSSDGMATGKVGERIFTGKFEGNSFAGSYPFPYFCGARPMPLALHRSQ